MRSHAWVLMTGALIVPTMAVALTGASATGHGKKPAYSYRSVTVEAGSARLCWYNNRVYSINDHHEIGGATYCHGHARAFDQRPGGGGNGWGLLNPNSTDSYVAGVANNGDVALYSANHFGPPYQAYYATAEGDDFDKPVEVVDPNAGSGGTVVNGINAHDVLVGGYFTGNKKSDFRTFIYDAKAQTYSDFAIHRAKVVDTELSGINDHGDMSGVWFDKAGVAHGFLVIDGKVKMVHIKGGGSKRGQGVFIEALASNGDYAGEVIKGKQVHGFVVRSGKRLNLTMPKFGTKYTSVQSVNRHGVVVGSYYGYKGLARGFVAKPN